MVIEVFFNFKYFSHVFYFYIEISNPFIIYLGISCETSIQLHFIFLYSSILSELYIFPLMCDNHFYTKFLHLQL